MGERKRAILVLGPASTGTRLLTRIVMACGYDGDGQHVQRWDTKTPNADQIVWRRSSPHGAVWPNVNQMVRALQLLDFEVKSLITIRDWKACSQSQVACGYVKTVDEAYRSIQYSYSYILSGLQMMGVPYQFSQYELLSDPQYREAMLGRFDLAITKPLEEIQNSNSKHYSE